MYAQANGAVNGEIHYRGEKSIELQGEWKFYWKKLYRDTPQLLDTPPTKLVYCPSLWNNTTVNGSELPSFGHATYTLDILCDNKYKSAALNIPFFYSAYRLYLNGEIISQNGTVGKDQDSSTLRWKTSYEKVALRKGRNQLVVEISNYHHSKGGFFAPVILGRSDFLFDKWEKKTISSTLIVGSLFAVGFFFLGMLLYWKLDNTVLYYSLFSISLALRTLNSSLYFLHKNLLSISGLTILKGEYISLYLSILFLTLFSFQVFFLNASRLIYKAQVFITLICIVATILLPLEIYSKIMEVYAYIGLSIIAYGCYTIIRTAIKQNKTPILISISYGLLSSGFGYYTLSYLGWLPKTTISLNSVFYASFVMMSFVMAKHYGKAYKTVERLRIETLEQKNTIEVLHEAQSKWFTNIAHELRTPLTLILGPINQFLKLYPDLHQTALKNIQVAQKNGILLQNLTNEILDISKLKDNKLTIRRETVQLSALIKDVAASFEYLSEQKKIALSTHLPINLNLNVDPNQIRKILTNLISNAFKFTPTEGKITISLENDENNTVFITVTDTGIGIEKKEQARIFERYYQSSNTNKGNPGGTGIGLTLSLELAKLHGGDLSVNSSVGKGSCFTLSLPSTSVIDINPIEPELQDVAPPSLPQNQLTQPKNNKPKKDKAQNTILLVEDNLDMRQYILDLMPSFYHVIEAKDGLEALEIVEKSKPDLIISDIMMPRMDGFQLLKKLKSNTVSDSLPIIMLTARTAPKDKMNALTMGVDDYLTKPFCSEELLARISKLLQNNQAKEEWRNQLPQEEKKSLSAEQQKFLCKIEAHVEDVLSNYEYSVADMAEDLKLSQRQLFNKVKAATGLSPLQYIREVRLQKARVILEAGEMDSVRKVMYSVGFRNGSHFAHIFRERFGKRPSEYKINGNKAQNNATDLTSTPPHL